MNTAPLAPKMGFKFTLRIRSGPDKGASFQLLPPRVNIGRGPQNDIVLSDPKVSRAAVAFEFSMEKIIVRDVSSRQTLRINGQLFQETSIKDGDTILIGDSEMQFSVEAIPLGPIPVPQTVGAPSLRHPSASGLPPSVPSGSNVLSFPEPGPINYGASKNGLPPPPHFHPSQARTGGGQDSGRLRFYMIIAILGLGLAWLLNSGSDKKNQEKGLKTVEEIEKEIQSSEENLENLVSKRSFANEAEKTRYKEAQVHYLEGFRDYQKGQYGRAIKSFETALAIDANHALAARYKRLAEKSRDEVIALLMIEGRSYRDKTMYGRCSAALEKVLDALPNVDDIKYRQAKTLKDECDLLHQERFRRLEFE